ncbi:MAG: JAB domain-containing protein [Urechidicola sp.]|nr:JAB domain-containing protein [Urechidicola sp.]
MYHITCAEDADKYLRLFIDAKQLDLRECFWVILMTNANNILAISEVATGTSIGVQPNPKYIFQLALLTNASAIIVAHSHPSGNLNISTSDIKETRKISSIAKAMDITLLDHIIITSESFVSFAQENKL